MSITWPSSPTLSSDGTSQCVGTAGPRPGAEVRGCPVVGVFSDSDCGWTVEAWAVERASCIVWAGWDEKAARGSRVRRAVLSAVERCCRVVVLCTVGVDERPSAAAESGDVRAVLYQFKTAQRILQRKWTMHTTARGNPYTTPLVTTNHWHYICCTGWFCCHMPLILPITLKKKKMLKRASSVAMTCLTHTVCIFMQHITSSWSGIAVLVLLLAHQLVFLWCRSFVSQENTNIEKPNL